MLFPAVAPEKFSEVFEDIPLKEPTIFCSELLMKLVYCFIPKIQEILRYIKFYLESILQYATARFFTNYSENSGKKYSMDRFQEDCQGITKNIPKRHTE